MKGKVMADVLFCLDFSKFYLNLYMYIFTSIPAVLAGFHSLRRFAYKRDITPVGIGYFDYFIYSYLL